MKTIGSSAVLLVGSFILHFIGLGLSQSFGIIYSELITFFDSGKSETSWIASLNSGLFLACGKFVQKQCLFLGATIFFVISFCFAPKRFGVLYNPFNTRKKSDIPDSNTTLGRRWSSGVRIVGPTSESNVGPS